MKALPILIALLAGLSLGAIGVGPDWSADAIGAAETTGGLWLNGLRMTIVPLVVALMITGIAKMGEAARAGKLAGRSVMAFLAVLWTSSILAALMMPVLTGMWPLNQAAGVALSHALSETKSFGAPATIKDFFLSIIPSNPVSAAANDAILPLIVFTAIFAFALLRLPEARRAPVTALFETIADAMLIVIGWVLKLAPIGVFALAFAVASKSGLAALGALAHYVVIVSAIGVLVWLAAWLVAWVGGRVRPVAFTRAIIPAQAVAISTRSSLATLPAMLKATEAIGVPAGKADVILPLAVALFRATGPAMNLAVALYAAHWLGIHPTPLQLIAGVAVAATTTLGAVSLPGELSFISSIAPIAMVLGVPIEPLALLVAVETLPDIVRTMGNVSMDVAVTAMVNRWTGTANQP